MLADISAILGSLDIVFGEIRRAFTVPVSFEVCYIWVLW